MKHHKVAHIKLDGFKAPLKSCSVPAAAINPPPLFERLRSDCKHIADRLGNYSEIDRKFIAEETRKLLEGGIKEERRSPWCPQVLVRWVKTRGK